MSIRDKTRHQAALVDIEQNPSKAAATLEQLSRTYPDHGGILFDLATAYYLSENYEKASQSLEQAEKVNVDLADAANLRGLISVKQHGYQEAAKAFQQALHHNGGHSEAHYNLALVYDIYLQDLVKAIEHYQHYLEHVPQDTDTAAWVAQLKHSLKQK